MRLPAAALLASSLLVLSGCPGATTCYSYCSDSTAVASSCEDAGKAAQCSSIVSQAFSGSTTVNGLSLDDCSSFTNDAGVLVDGGCGPPTLECVASGCAQPIDCTKVLSCTGI